MYFLSPATVLIKEVTNKKRVGIDSIAAAGEMLWGIKYMKERRNTKLVALSIWLLLLLSLPVRLNWKEPPRIASAVINTFSFLISLPLLFLCVLFSSFLSASAGERERKEFYWYRCCLRRAAHYRSAFVGMFFFSMSPLTLFFYSMDIIIL